MHIKNFSALFPALLCAYLCHAQNLAPNVTLSAPANGTIFQQGQIISLTANANDPDGSIDKVEFYQDGQLIGEASDAPFEYQLGFTPPGVYSFAAKAFDNKGASKISTAISVTVNAQPFAFLSSPANNSIFHGSGNLILLARVGDTDDAVRKVAFFQNGVKIGEDTIAPYSLSLSNLEPGPYFFAVQAFDSRGGSGVSTPSAVLVNAVPVVQIGGARNGDIYPQFSTLNFEVSALDPDGTVKKVEFYLNNSKIAEDSIAPYEYEYSANTYGNFNFFVRATDNLGGIAASGSLTFVVNAPPIVAIASPVTGAKYTPGSVLTLQANTSDVDGSVSRVEFWQNGEKLGEDMESPFTFIVNNLNSGPYIYAAKAFDNFGASSTSSPIAVIVNAPPSLNFQSPTSDTTILQNTPLTVRLNANDSDGEILRVELYLNDIKVGEDGQAPYAITLNNLPLGVHKLKAKAWDDVDEVKESKVINLTVNTPTSTREVNYREIQFFPNPVKEKIYLIGLSESTRIRIYDALGRLVQESSARSELDVQNLDVGRYWLITQNGQRASFVKF
ncbi:MAG: Ig-like domain-containing protein [Haliscomenobacter sp.]|uniref:Ig-like domain-containing protein n=1 Tax=Haliscomenobacter sp. TaxID=2717303 RepID=UPI0029A5284F|nr:Ig-like domain-containing protein [Haliscomenobacter sp.]MDX2067174.1 Ig-like domain-containing protein [Haliscomenobacter sp.]